MAPDALNGDQFAISVLDGSNGTAVVQQSEIIWASDNSPVIQFGGIERVNGVACAMWSSGMFVEAGYDANCCFAVRVEGNQKVYCETSQLCVGKARKLIK